MKKRDCAIALEISGATAMWTRPDTGDSPVSYPVPTYSAVKGVFESILFNQCIKIVPTKVEICSPVIYHQYNSNYGGPLRKSALLKNGSSFQLLATVLINPCYRLHARLETCIPSVLERSEKTKSWLSRTTNPAHAFQDIFNRRIKRGQSFSIPFLGWKEFTPDYVGEFRPDTVVQKEINQTIPSMIREVFPHGLNSKVDFVYEHNIAIENGILNYERTRHAE